MTNNILLNETFDFVSNTTHYIKNGIITKKPEFNDCYTYFKEPLEKYFGILIIVLIWLFFLTELYKPKKEEQKKLKNIFVKFTYYGIFVITIFITALLYLT